MSQSTAIEVKSDGNMYFKGQQDIRFGDNADWSMEYYGGGLNFWKPYGTNTGDYKFFCMIMGMLVLIHQHRKQNWILTEIKHVE